MTYTVIMNSHNPIIREPVVEGIFYPADPEELSAAVAKLSAGVSTLKSPARCIAVPHAGYEIAGESMAKAFAAVSGHHYRRLVLVGPLHYDCGLDGVILPESDIFATALGDIPVDRQAIEQLCTCSTGIRCNDIPHLEEHGLEVLLPLVRHFFPDVPIVPILLSKPSQAMVRMLGQALQLSFAEESEDTLYVVSMNLTANKQSEDAAREADALIALLESGDWSAILDAHLNKSLSSCGIPSLSAVMAFGKKSGKPQVVCRERSPLSDPGGTCVEYAGIVFSD